MGKSHFEVPGDVFEEADLRLYLLDDPREVRPEVARVRESLLVARDREGLARIASREEMNAAAPRAAVEGLNVIPDRRTIQGRVVHPRHEGRCSCGFPLDETNSSVPGFCDVQAKLQAAVSGAESDSVDRRQLGGR